VELLLFGHHTAVVGLSRMAAAKVVLSPYEEDFAQLHRHHLSHFHDYIKQNALPNLGLTHCEARPSVHLDHEQKEASR
jgi:hypothetical protein